MRLILARHILALLLVAANGLAVSPAFAQEGLLPAPGGAEAQAPAVPAGPGIDAEVDPAEDQAIARRLRTTYDTVEGLAPVQVRVASGVVVLTGEVSAQALRQQAARLAANVRGVAEVENRIEVAQDLEGRLTPALRRLAEVWTGFVRLLPVLLLGAGIMAVAFIVGRWLARLNGFYRRISANAFIAGLLAQVVQTAVLLAGLALTMLLLDATGVVNTLLGAAGIVGLALGFALRDTVENYIASILLSVRRPFDPFDYVRIEGHEGMVIRLTSRATVLMNQDGNQIRIPNAIVFKGLIVNFTRRTQRRFAFSLGISPDEDLGKAQRVAVEALAQVDGVLADPAPSALYESVGESAVNMTVAGWMDQTSHDFLRVRSEAIRVVLTRMAAAHVDLPEPTLRLRRAPRAAPGVSDTKPAMATGRDSTLNRAVEQERIRGQDGLAQAGREE